MTKLAVLIKQMIDSGDKGFKNLPRGLVISYTPQPSDDRPKSGNRFVWSRRDGIPSEVEDQIVRTIVLKLLANRNDMAIIGGPTFRTMVKLKEGWMSSVLTWRWIAAKDVIGLSPTERRNLMDWREKWAEDLID